MAAEPEAQVHARDAHFQFRPWPCSHAGDHSSDRSATTAASKALAPAIHVDMPVGSPQHPLDRSALACAPPQSVDPLPFRSDIPALDKLSWASGVVFGLRLLAMCRSCDGWPSVIELASWRVFVIQQECEHPEHCLCSLILSQRLLS